MTTLRLFWNWLLYQLSSTFISQWIGSDTFWLDHSCYCPKCQGCGYWECCMPCMGGIFCAKLYTEEDKNEYRREKDY